MKVPIPSDWDGESWFCSQLQWPDSPQFIALLTGILSVMTRGRYWDEDTGTITDIQAVARDIFNRNFPFVPCSSGGDDEPEPDPVFIYQVMSAYGSEECEMSGCSIPYGSIKYIDGVLSYLYCGVWYPVEGAPVIDGAITDDYIPPEIEGGGYSACGKADAVMQMVYGVIESILDEVGNLSIFWWGHVKADNPGVGMDAKWIIAACFGAVNQASADAIAEDAYDPDALDASTWQSVKCALARDFTDTMPEPLDGNEIRTKLQNYFASEWGLDVLTNAIFVDALRGINKESFEAAVKVGASYDAADCDCPTEGQPTGTSANGWFWGPELQYLYETPDNFQTFFVKSKLVCPHDVYGVAITATQLTGEINKYKRSNDDGGDATYDVFMFGSNSDTWYSNMGNWHCQVDPDIATEVLALLDGTPVNHSPQFASSETLLSPSAAQGQIAAAYYSFGGPSGTGTGLAKVRWLFNKNSPSHG